MSREVSMSIREFLNKDIEDKKHKRTTKIIVTSCVAAGIILTSPFEIVEASAGNIDAGARIIYGKLLAVGKWVIIIKGGIDTINNAVQGNMDAAKKSFLSYLMVYLVLQALPWAMDEVDNVFRALR